MTPTEQQLNDVVEIGLFKSQSKVMMDDLNYIRDNILSELKPLFDELVKDKERLDWLEARYHRSEWLMNLSQDARKEIDQAISKEQIEPKE